jgi:hypothetical protein
VNLMTPEYASPEQVQQAPLGTASDVYSLGVVLYELLTGHRPYQMRTRIVHEMARVICEEEPTRPSVVVMQSEPSDTPTSVPVTPEVVSAVREGDPARLRSRLAGDLDSILLKALRKLPDDRYPSADALNDDLRRHLQNLPVAARRGTRRYRIGRFVSRHRAPLVLAGLVVATLFAGVATTLWQQRLALRNARQNLMLPQLTLYTYALVAVLGTAVYVSRATLRRLSGAAAGAAAFVLTGIVASRTSMSLGLWHPTATDVALTLPIALVVLDAWCYTVVLALIGWRVGRRFGWRGQLAFTLIMSIWGAARDYAGAMASGLVTIAPGLAPFLGWSTAWCCGLVMMQVAMWFVAGPAAADSLTTNVDPLRLSAFQRR